MPFTSKTSKPIKGKKNEIIKPTTNINPLADVADKRTSSATPAERVGKGSETKRVKFNSDGSVDVTQVGEGEPTRFTKEEYNARLSGEVSGGGGPGRGSGG